MLRWLSLVAAVALLGHATWILVLDGMRAFSCTGWNRADFFVASAVPSLALVPLFVLGYQAGRQHRYRRCGLFFAWGVQVFGLALLVPSGIYAAGWYSQPVLVLLVTCLFGAIPGIAQAALVVAAASVATSITAPVEAVHVPGAWMLAAVVSAAVTGMAFLGSLLQRTLSLAISAEEDQNLRMDEARRALRHRENLLRHAMRVDTVGEMASMVVHQLRNQFQLVMGYAGVGMQTTDDDATRSHFGSIVETLEQSTDLLEGLLGMSRREAAGVAVIDLTGRCKQMAESYRRVLPTGIEFRVDTPDHPVPVSLDAQGLEHALLNLVINARQAIGTRATGTPQAVGRAAEIRLRLTTEGDVARLQVSDTGPGIAAGHLDRVFQPFFTTKPKGEGTGLGLAAVQRFVRASRGEVTVESRVGAGTTFTLEFPLAPAQRRSG